MRHCVFIVVVRNVGRARATANWIIEKAFVSRNFMKTLFIRDRRSAATRDFYQGRVYWGELFLEIESAGSN